MTKLTTLVLTTALLSCQAFAEPLNILLTNDDGYNAPGIIAVKKALQARGHQVTVVAPEGNQSGASVSFTAGNLSFVQKKPGIWAVGGRPADSVRVGLGYLFKDNKPDLVVSGANMGQNLAADTNSSGTVGAAIMAMQMGVPAIAVSCGVNFNQRAVKSQFASTLAVFPDVAEFIAKLIDRLDQTRGRNKPLLPARTVLNVNYPALSRYQIKGVKMAPLGTSSIAAVTYEKAREGTLKAVRQASSQVEEVKSADSIWFNQGFITISVLDGDWSANKADKRIWKRLKKLEP